MSEASEVQVIEAPKAKRKYTRRTSAKARTKPVLEKKVDFRDVLVKRIVGSIASLPESALLDLLLQVAKAA